MTSDRKHYTSGEVSAYLTGAFSEDEAAAFERHLAGCDRCVRRARREYRAATVPAFWTPRAPVAEAPVPRPEPWSPPLRFQLAEQWVRRGGLVPSPGFRYRTPAFAAGAILLVALGYYLRGISGGHSPIPVVNDPVEASLIDGGGPVTLTRSGKVVLPGGNALPSARAVVVQDLLTKSAVPQPENVQLALAATRTGLLERGPSQVATENPVLLSPFATAVSSTRPTFSWRPVKGAASYIVYIEDRREKLVWQSPAGAGTSLTLPQTAPELARGELYRWQLEAKGTGPSRFSDWDSFVVLNQPGSEAIAAAQRDYPNSALLLGALYEEYGLYADAEAQFQRLAALNPSSPLPGKMQASLALLRKNL